MSPTRPTLGSHMASPPPLRSMDDSSVAASAYASLPHDAFARAGSHISSH